MWQLLIGLAILLFGIIFGSVGLATAGVGIGIPMIPLGLYVAYRGFRIVKHESAKRAADEIDKTPLIPLEKTKEGKIGLGILLVLVGLGTSALLIGIPVAVVGFWLLYKTLKDDIAAFYNRNNTKDDDC